MGHEHNHVDRHAGVRLAGRFHLEHATLQVETAGNHDCEEMTW
jgi:hypothetical protein